MWIMANFGAFMPARRPPKTIAEGDERIMQVRARRREHLDRLREHYMPDLGPTYEIAHSDYEFRANCTPAALAAAMVKITLDIDYVSFKHTTTTQWGDSFLEGAYMQIWAAINRALAPPASQTDKPHAYQRDAGQRFALWPTDPDEWEANFDRVFSADTVNDRYGDVDNQEAYESGEYDKPNESIDDALEGARAAATDYCQVDTDGYCHTAHHVHAGIVKVAEPTCLHEAWEEDSAGTPYKCADCGHWFSELERVARQPRRPARRRRRRGGKRS